MTSNLTSHHLYPPFADGIKTAPLVSVSFAKLKSGDKGTSDAFFKACKELGFFYLDMLGSELGERIVQGAEKLQALQKEFFKLPNEVKDRYGESVVDPFFAYRYTETGEKDENGAPKRKENYNIRKDDLLDNCPRLDCHPMVLDNQETFKKYTLDCRAAIDLMLDQINMHLGLPEGTLANMHRIDHLSGDHVRFTQAPPGQYHEAGARKGEHTDHGSITILFNWLGGLQIRMPDPDAEWVSVRPIPGSCVVNLGDAMVKFTAGLLRSNIHRVVPPQGEQAGMTRNSLVYFSRPENDVVLRRLKGGIIDEQPVSDNAGEPELTAHEWIMAKVSRKLPGVYTKKGFEYKENDERLKERVDVGAKPTVAV